MPPRPAAPRRARCGIDPTFRPLVVLVGLIGAVALGESVGANIGGAMARRLGNGLARRGRPDGGRRLRGGPGAADHVARRQPAGRRAGPAPGRDRRQRRPRPDDDRDPAAADRDRRRARRLARRRPGCPTSSSASNRCRRPPVDRPTDPAARAIADGRRGEHGQGLGRHVRPVGRSGPGSSSPMATSSPTRTSWPAPGARGDARHRAGRPGPRRASRSCSTRSSTSRSSTSTALDAPPLAFASKPTRPVARSGRRSATRAAAR